MKIDNMSLSGTPAPDPFDIANLRIDHTSQISVKKLLTTIPVRKPVKQDFIRVHPNDDFNPSGLGVIEIKEENETYLITPKIVSVISGLVSIVSLHTAITRQGVVFLWPTKLPTPDGRSNQWHTSAADAAEFAKKSWIRVQANISLGAYDIFRAEGDLPDPEWPDSTFTELLKVAFRNKLVDSEDHPLIDLLRGRS